MACHSEQVNALAQLISSINFGPQELRRLRFEAEQGIARQDELKERAGAEWLAEVLDRNTGCPHNDIEYGYEELEELRNLVGEEVRALRKEIRKARNERVKSEAKENRKIDGLSRLGTNHTAESYVQPSPIPDKVEVNNSEDLKAWTSAELEKLKKELQDSAVDSRCKCEKDKGTTLSNDSSGFEERPARYGERQRR